MSRMFVVVGLLALVGTGCSKQDTSLLFGSSCASPGPVVGKMVYYTGSKSDDGKFRHGRDYVGKVLAVLHDGMSEVEWTPDSAGTTAVYISSISTEATCNPSLVGKRVLYTGTKSDEGDFQHGKDYFGKVVATYTNNYIQVKWDHLPDTIKVHYSSTVNVQQ